MGAAAADLDGFERGASSEGAERVIKGDALGEEPKESSEALSEPRFFFEVPLPVEGAAAASRAIFLLPRRPSTSGGPSVDCKVEARGRRTLGNERFGEPVGGVSVGESREEEGGL